MLSDGKNFECSTNIYVKSVLFAGAFLAFCFVVLFSPQVGGGGEDVGFIALAALIFFSFIFSLGCISERLYWLGAPFVIIFTPNAVNDFLPSAQMGEGGAPFFSYFTHVDIYLFMGLLRYCDFRKGQKPWLMVCVFSVFSLLVLSLSVAVTREYGWVVAWGSYQLRYFLLLLLLFVYASPMEYEKFFSYSFIFALLLVGLEASVFTYLTSAERLGSGNYGVNTLGHLLAAGAAVSFIFPFKSRLFGKELFFLVGCLLVFAVYLTGTRFSLAALGMAGAVLFIIRYGALRGMLAAVLACVCFSFIFFNYVPAGVSAWEGLSIVGRDYSDPGSILVTPESSSMVTRLVLWWGTLGMIEAFPVFGGGAGMWAFLKGEFGIPFEAVLDPHQDILNYLFSYGLLGGGLFFIFVFLWPVFKAYLHRSDSRVRWHWIFFMLVFIVAGVSNAVTWKHQIAAIFYYASLMSLFSLSGRSIKHA